jgi:ankyrin repeat protein
MDVGKPFISANSTGNAELEEPPILILARSISNRDDVADKFALLIERGAHPNVRDNEGDSCLHIIMSYNHLPERRSAEKELPDILMILVTGGADVFATNHHGDTVSHAALRSGYTYIWKQVLEDCGYNAEAVLSYSPIWTAGLNDQQEEALLSQRSKLSLKDYCQRRILLPRFEELDSDNEEDDYDSDATGWHESEEHFYRGYTDGDYGIDVAGQQDSGGPVNSRQEALGGRTAAEEDYMSLFTYDDWGYVVED